MKDAGVGLVFLCFEKDAFEVSVCSAVVDNERNLRFLRSENVVAERGFLQGGRRIRGTEEIEPAFAKSDDAFGVLCFPSEQLLCCRGRGCGREVCGVSSCGAEDTGVARVCRAEVEEGLLFGEGCCDGEEDGDIGGEGVFENCGERREVGDFGLALFEEEIEVAMGVDEGEGRGRRGLRVHGGMIVGFGGYEGKKDIARSKTRASSRRLASTRTGSARGFAPRKRPRFSQRARQPEGLRAFCVRAKRSAQPLTSPNARRSHAQAESQRVGGGTKICLPCYACDIAILTNNGCFT